MDQLGISYDAVEITINVASAIALGLAIDRSFQKVKLDTHPWIRIFLHFVILIAGVFALNIIYNRFGISQPFNDFFFMSIYLGVQKNLSEEIQNLV